MKLLRNNNIDLGAIMKLSKVLKNTLLIIFACFALSACATSKKSTGQMQGDVYTGTDTVESVSYTHLTLPTNREV